MAPAAGTARALDAVAVSRGVERAAAADAPWLHAEVARRMAERLPVIRTQPATVVEWWGHLGASDAALAAVYPKARRVWVEPGPDAAARAAERVARPWWSARRWSGSAVEVRTEDDVPPGSAQLLWSNMMLQAAVDPPALMARWRRVLDVDGFLMLSTFGPDTLRELRSLYQGCDWGPAMAPFVDMHDLGDMLVQAGFADPVMDQELVTLHWATPEALLAELRGLGRNADPARHAGLRTPRWRQRLVDRLRERAMPDGRIALSFEIAYGHAFNPAPRPKVAAETSVPLDDLRRMVRAGSRKG